MMSRIAGLLRRTFGIVREHAGTDHLGNKYYIIPEQKTWTGRLVRAKRTVVAANPIECEYVEGSIPSEWDAWIRGRRKEPPSAEELLRNERYRERVKLKAREVEHRDMDLRAKEYEEGLAAAPPPRTAVKGHAVTTGFGEQRVGQEPASTAKTKTFLPGSWRPPNAKK